MADLKNTYITLKLGNGGGSGSGVTPQDVQQQIDSALTLISETQQVAAAGLNELEGRIDELSAATPSVDLSGYYTSAQTENAITSKNYVTSAQVETQIVSKNYITSADTANFVTSAQVETQIEAKNYVNSGDVKSQVEAYNYATVSQIPTVPTSNTAFTNDAGYITSADTANFITSAATANMVTSTSVSTIWKGTQAQYDAIATKDPNTFYIIVNN